MARFKKKWAWVTAAMAVFLGEATANARKPDRPGNDGIAIELVDLNPSEASESEAYAINSDGIVVGAGVFAGEWMAGTWNVNDQVPTFSLLPGSAGGAHAINSAGEVVGWSASSQGGPRYWASLTDEPTDLPLPSGFTQTWRAIQTPATLRKTSTGGPLR